VVAVSRITCSTLEGEDAALGVALVVAALVAGAFFAGAFFAVAFVADAFLVVAAVLVALLATAVSLCPTRSGDRWDHRALKRSGHAPPPGQSRRPR
jgi:hypothetical protein